MRWDSPRLSLPVVVAAALVVALAPAVVLVAAPLVLGAPHLVSDVRHLVLRRRLPVPLIAVSAAAAATLFGLRLVEVAGHAPPGSARAEALVAAAWIGVCAIAGWHTHPVSSVERSAAPTPVARGRVASFHTHLAGLARIAPFLCVALLLAIAPPAASRAAVILLHNVVAVALWIAVFRPPRGWAAAIVGTSALGVALLAFLGPGIGAFALGSSPLLDPALLATATAFAPGLSPGKALGALEAALFLQLVHYATWLAWIPSESRRQARDGGIARRTELAIAGVVAAAPIAAALVLVGAAGPRAARDAYLSLASFHAYLELAVWAFLATRSGAASGRHGVAPLAIASGAA